MGRNTPGHPHLDRPAGWLFPGSRGPLGFELQAQMPVPNSKTLAPHRFLGIDGPRWLLRVTLYGKAGSDEAAANELIEIVRDIVVNRGHDPHPPRELLPLEIPEQATQQG
ncbi:DUF3710 domain-containing protein [Trueperella pyogenes]